MSDDGVAKAVAGVKDQTLFQVSRITNHANRTIFVDVAEIVPATVPGARTSG